MRRERPTGDQLVMKEGEGRTHQSFKDAADINLTMKRWANSGQLGEVNERVPQYGDFSNVPDYLTAFNAIKQAEEDFLELPAAVRKACQNNAGIFIDMVFDPERRAELEQLGLIKTRAPAQAPPAAVAKPEPILDPAPKPTPQGGE